MRSVFITKVVTALMAAVVTWMPLHAASGIGGNPELGGCAYTFWGCDQHGNVYDPSDFDAVFDYEMSAGTDVVALGGELYRLGGNRTLLVWDSDEGDHGAWVSAPARLVFDACVWNFWLASVNICKGTWTFNPPGPFHWTTNPED